MKKARSNDREDKDGLEIALQAKQQELDLVSRVLSKCKECGADRLTAQMKD